MASLAAAVDRLYVAFSGVRRPTVIEYCQCCFCEEEERALRALLAPVALRQGRSGPDGVSEYPKVQLPRPSRCAGERGLAGVG